MPYITSMTYGRSFTIERMGVEQGRKEGERSLSSYRKRSLIYLEANTLNSTNRYLLKSNVR
jgi:hypothetical protein